MKWVSKKQKWLRCCTKTIKAIVNRQDPRGDEWVVVGIKPM